MQKTDIKSMNIDELKDFMQSIGEKSFRAVQIYEWLHVKLVSGFDEMTNLSKDLRLKLKEKCSFTHLEEADRLVSSADGTTKFLFRLSDGNFIESVLMKYHHGNSVCISSQCGCRMGCKFCASAIDGLARNLTPAEMLEEVYQIQRLSNNKVSNIVIMGTGEPLDNYDNVVKFLHLISDENGLNISQRNITLSTCGLIDRIRSLAEEDFSITLALSLHASNDEDRKKLMPIANRYTISEVLKACDYYYEKTKRRISYEYSLVAGVNDTPKHAYDLFRLLKGKNCHVNLIPVNPVKERDFRRSELENILNFKNILEKNRINVTIRREMGTDINAACGQLRKSYSDKIKRGGKLAVMKAFSITDKGIKRENNQDYIYCCTNKIGIFDNLFIVADGMGGHSAGDFASRYSVEEFVKYIEAAEEKTIIGRFEAGIAKINKAVIGKAFENPSLTGMGTTFVVSTVNQNSLYVANIGDSRLYVISDGIIEQITQDHSLVEEMIKNGQIKREEARLHPKKNIITRAIGVDTEVIPDFFETSLKYGDIILMCSDGLSNMLEDKEMCSIIIRNKEDLSVAATKLVEAANANGGFDNISVILAKFDCKENF